MPATITVLYPSTPDATFNMDYYMSTHMPLVTQNWQSEGMIGWKISKFVGTGSGDPPPYTVSATLYFESIESFQKAAQGPKGPSVMGDIPNFSNKEPIILVAEDVGTHGSGS